jgi:hypothetical protein
LNQNGSLTGADIAVLATMKLTELSICDDSKIIGLRSLGAFVGSNISRTLESFEFSIHAYVTPPIHADLFAPGLAACHKLKKLDVYCGRNAQAFGMKAMHAIVIGCRLLTHIELQVPVDGLRAIAAAFPRLKKFTPVVDIDIRRMKYLQAYHPTIVWEFDSRHLPRDTDSDYIDTEYGYYGSEGGEFDEDDEDEEDGDEDENENEDEDEDEDEDDDDDEDEDDDEDDSDSNHDN